MARPSSAGALRHRVAFDRRELTNPDSPNDYGNTVGYFVEQFQTMAQIIHLRGSEAVMAGRLQGRHTQIVRVRSLKASRQVETDWRMRDLRSGTPFAVRDVTPSEDGQWLDILCESGVPA